MLVQTTSSKVETLHHSHLVKHVDDRHDMLWVPDTSHQVDVLECLRSELTRDTNWSKLIPITTLVFNVSFL